MLCRADTLSEELKKSRVIDGSIKRHHLSIFLRFSIILMIILRSEELRIETAQKLVSKLMKTFRKVTVITR